MDKKMWTTTQKRYGKILLIFLALALFTFLFMINILKTVPFESLPNTGSLGMLLVTEHTGLDQKNTVYRLKDNAPQTIPGKWKHAFTLPHEIIFYGFTPEKPQNQTIFSLNDIRAFIKDPSQLPGEVISIDASPDSEYLLVSGIKKDGTPYSCISQRKTHTFNDCKDVLGTLLPEGTYKSEFAHLSFWKPGEGANLYILENSSEKRAFLYAMASNTKKEITDATEKETIEMEFNTSVTPPAVKQYSLGPLTIIQHKSGEFAFFIERGVQQVYTFSQKNILVKKKDGIWLADLSKNEKALITPISEGSTSDIDFYFKNR